MKKFFLILIGVWLLPACQQGSETFIRSEKMSPFSSEKKLCELPTINPQTGGSFIFEMTDADGCIEPDSRIIELAPLGWHGEKGEDPLMTWDEANQTLKSLKINGVGGWRLPSGWELVSSCEYQLVCTGESYPRLNADEWASDNSENGRQMKREGEIAAESEFWWWTQTAISGESLAVVMTPRFRRTFAHTTEKFRVRPIRVERDGSFWSSPEWSSDLDEVSGLTCYQSSLNQVQLAWRDICSKFQMCGNWDIRGCVSEVSEVTKTRRGLIVVVLNDESIDTYSYLGRNGWSRTSSQKVPWLLDPDRTDGSTFEIAFADVTKDGEPELAIRKGPADFYMAADSADLAVLRWSVKEDGWVRLMFPSPTDAEWINYVAEGEYRWLRWGLIRDGDIFEEFGYLQQGGHREDVAFRYQWVTNRFEIKGTEKLAPTCFTILGEINGRCYVE